MSQLDQRKLRTHVLQPHFVNINSISDLKKEQELKKKKRKNKGKKKCFAETESTMKAIGSLSQIREVSVYCSELYCKPVFQKAFKLLSRSIFHNVQLLRSPVMLLE